MSNSKLATVHYWTKNYSSRNGAKISTIIIHHMAGNLDAKGCYNVWKNANGSAHYAISSKGEIGQLIDEKYRAWSVADAAADSKAVTIEVANDKGASGSWHVSDKAIAACIELCVDICQRNGIKRLNFTGDKTGNLLQHKMFMETACPGPFLASKFKYIQDETNKRLGAEPEKKWTDYKVPFTVRVEIDDLYIKRGPGISYAREKVDGSVFIKPGVYTITQVKKGGDYWWGKLKSSTASSPRWIALDYTTFVKEVTPAPTPAKTPQEKICEWAKSTAASGKYKYKSWESSDEKTKQCPICHSLTGKYCGFNCIGWAFACWRHGGGLKSNCSCSVISDPKWEAILKASTDAEALKIAQDRIGIKDIKVIRNGGKVIPTSKLMPGDIVSFFNGSNYYHTAVYVGDGKVCDITSSRSPAIKYGVLVYDGLKVAIRYTGK